MLDTGALPPNVKCQTACCTLSNELVSTAKRLDGCGILRAAAQAMNATPSRANDLEKRLINFASQIVHLPSKLPRTPQGRDICNQILRSGTAAAGNYGDARGAESRADFIHKFKIVFKELNETTIWSEVISQSSLLPPETVAPVLNENRELCRIIGAFIRTARASRT